MKKLAEIISAEIDEGDHFTLFVWGPDNVHYISAMDHDDMRNHLLAWLELQQDEETRH